MSLSSSNGTLSLSWRGTFCPLKNCVTLIDTNLKYIYIDVSNISIHTRISVVNLASNKAGTYHHPEGNYEVNKHNKSTKREQFQIYRKCRVEHLGILSSTSVYDWERNLGTTAADTLQGVSVSFSMDVISVTDTS